MVKQVYDATWPVSKVLEGRRNKKKKRNCRQNFLFFVTLQLMFEYIKPFLSEKLKKKSLSKS